MGESKLFYVKDYDRPMWVVACDWQEALKKWTIFIAVENEITVNEVSSPNGIDFVCDSNELIL